MSQLTRSLQDRLFVGVLSAVFAPATGYWLFAAHSRPLPQANDWFLRTFAFLSIEAVTAVFFVTVFGFIWAIWTPDWIERRLKSAVLKFLVVLSAVALFLTGISFYMLVSGVR